MISLAEAREIVQEVNGLPTLPSIVSELLERMEDPNSSVGSITEIIERDPAIGAKILQLVNSAFYALPRRIGSLHNAIGILGFNPVRNVVLAATFFNMFRKERIGFDSMGFWLHCLCVGIAAKTIARRQLPDYDHDSAFVYGMLHDIGKIFMAGHMENDIAVVLQAVRQKELSFLDAEEAGLGYGHADIGSALAEHWRFPTSLAQAIRFHHRIDANRPSLVEASLVHVGDAMARALQVGWCGDSRIYPVSPVAWETLHLADSALDAIMDEIHSGMIAAEPFIDLIHESRRQK